MESQPQVLATPDSPRTLPRCLASLLRFAIVFLPAWLLLVLIAQNAVNMPVWDDWDRATLFEKWDAGTLTFADLYAPHIDHRTNECWFSVLHTQT